MNTEILYSCFVETYIYLFIICLEKKGKQIGLIKLHTKQELCQEIFIVYNLTGQNTNPSHYIFVSPVPHIALAT